MKPEDSMNMKGRTEEELPDLTTDMADAQASWPAPHESRGDGKHEGVQERSMMEQVLDRENLERAWKRVRANHGAPGVDGMNVESFTAFFSKHWERIRSALMDGTYQPAPVRRVWIPKSDGSKRPLGVPTVLDRVIQQALAQVMSPLFVSGFSDHSYGFLEGRNAHQAVRLMEACWKEKRRHAVDCDLKSFFDTVNHDRLMGQLRVKVRDRKVLGLIRFVEGKLKLVINRAKSQAAPLKQCSFLGFQIGSRGKLVWTTKVLKRFKDRVREITSRNRGHRVEDVIVELRRYVVGWLNYFGISHTYKVLLDLEEWMRRRVRLYYWKQWKQPRTRRRHLIALGISPDEVKLASRSRKGYWRMSANRLVQYAMNNAWLHKQGVPEMKEQWIALHYPDQPRDV